MQLEQLENKALKLKSTIIQLEAKIKQLEELKTNKDAALAAVLKHVEQMKELKAKKEVEIFDYKTFESLMCNNTYTEWSSFKPNNKLTYFIRTTDGSSIILNQPITVLKQMLKIVEELYKERTYKSSFNYEYYTNSDCTVNADQLKNNINLARKAIYAQLQKPKS